MSKTVMSDQSTNIEKNIRKINKERGEGKTFNLDLTEFNGNSGFVATIKAKNFSEVTKKDIIDFRNEQKNIIENIENVEVKLGVFNLINKNGVDVDLNVIVDSKEKAIDIGKKFNQESVFDLKNKECIPTGGRGKQIKSNPVKEVSEVI